MTFTIPAWILWGVGIVAGLAFLAVAGFSIWFTWIFLKHWGPPRW